MDADCPAGHPEPLSRPGYLGLVAVECLHYL